EVTLGGSGILGSLSASAIHVAMGTHSVGAIQLLAAAHHGAKQRLVAAPVLGRPDAAAAGQVLVVAAGEPDALNQCEPLFQAIGRRTFPAGSKPEGASAIKLSMNFMLGSAIEAM